MSLYHHKIINKRSQLFRKTTYTHIYISIFMQCQTFSADILTHQSLNIFFCMCHTIVITFCYDRQAFLYCFYLKMNINELFGTNIYRILITFYKCGTFLVWIHVDTYKNSYATITYCFVLVSNWKLNINKYQIHMYSLYKCVLLEWIGILSRNLLYYAYICVPITVLEILCICKNLDDNKIPILWKF